MKKPLILTILVFVLLIIALLCIKVGMRSEHSSIRVQVIPSKTEYIDGENISYVIQVTNFLQQTIYYKNGAYNVEITGDNGFHVLASTEGTHRTYECQSQQTIERDMAAYGSYNYMLAMNIPNIDAIPSLGLSKQNELQLPSGKYKLNVTFTYYLDEECQSEPQISSTQFKLVIQDDGSERLEETTTLEGKFIFTVNSDKAVYQKGENLRTWATISWIPDEEWYPWYDEANWLRLYFIAIDKSTDEHYDIGATLTNLPPNYQKDIFYNPIISKYDLPSGNYQFKYDIYYLDMQGEEKHESIALDVTIKE